MDRRFIPGLETYESMYKELTDLVERLEREDPDFHCTLSVLDTSVMASGYVHQGMEQREDDRLVQIVKRSLESVSGRDAELVGCPCWTDAGLFGHYARVPVVIYGPGDIAMSHSKEECIDPAAIEESFRVFTAAALDFCGCAAE
jgi:acetylornithine deacetylase/succinyl-diaminopimelate desuccinylase